MTTATMVTLQNFLPPVSAFQPSTSTSCHLAPCFHFSTRFGSPGLADPTRHFGQTMMEKKMMRRRILEASFVGTEDTELRVPDPEVDRYNNGDVDDEDPSPEDLEYVSQIKIVLELLRKNRDMLFSEVKLTVMIEDPREVERRRLLGLDDSEGPTRDDLVSALEEVNEGKIPRNRIALRMLAEEMLQWPNLEVEASKKTRGKSLYAKATDTGVDPKKAAQRLNIDWDSAAEIEDVDVTDDTEVPAAVGYGALYLVTAFPVIIGISVVLILFYNSLQ